MHVYYAIIEVIGLDGYGDEVETSTHVTVWIQVNH